MAHSSPTSAKQAMRFEMRALRRGLAKASPNAAERAAEHLPPALLSRFKVVAGYAPQGAELDPGPVMRRFAAAGARIALPVSVAAGAPLVFRALAPVSQCIPDAAGVPAPPPDAEELEPDLLIAPLLAFDRSGMRLGQGAGYFDRTIAALRQRGSVFTLGLAYAGQGVARVPAEEHDLSLDAILTEIEYMEVRRDA